MEATGNRQAAETLGWVSMGTGLASAVVGLAPATAQSTSKVGKFIGGWQHKLQNAGGVPRFARSASLGGQPATTLADMPDAVMENLALYLTGNDLKNLSLTSRRIKELVKSNTRPLGTVLPELTEQKRGDYVSRVRRIWSGEEHGVLPSQLQEAGIDIAMSKRSTDTSMSLDDLRSPDMLSDYDWTFRLDEMNYNYQQGLITRQRRYSV
jgi:hypothetical protein